MAKDQRNDDRGSQADADYTSRQTDEGTEGFTGGGNVGSRPDFAGRPNVTEERQDRALDPNERASEDVDTGSDRGT